MPWRRDVWEALAGEWKFDMMDELAQEISLDQLDTAIEKILKGELAGRTVVNLEL